MSAPPCRLLKKDPIDEPLVPAIDVGPCDSSFGLGGFIEKGRYQCWVRQSSPLRDDLPRCSEIDGAKLRFL